jgi:hypothetical protein
MIYLLYFGKIKVLVDAAAHSEMGTNLMRHLTEICREIWRCRKSNKFLGMALEHIFKISLYFGRM